MTFDMEVHRLGLALTMQLSSVVIEWKFTETKGYLGTKDT